MPELVDSARLLENAPPVGIGEEVQKWPRQPVVPREPHPGQLLIRPRRIVTADEDPYQKQGRSPKRVPRDGTHHKPGYDTWPPHRRPGRPR